MPMHANLVCNTHACNYNRAIVHYHMRLWQVRMPFSAGFPDIRTAAGGKRARFRARRDDIADPQPDALVDALVGALVGGASSALLARQAGR